MDIIIQIKNCHDRTGNLGCKLTVSTDENEYPKHLSNIVGKVFYSNNRKYQDNYCVYWRETPSNIEFLKSSLNKLFEKDGHSVLILD